MRAMTVATVPGEHPRSDPHLRDRVYALLEHDHLVRHARRDMDDVTCFDILL